MSTSKKRSLSPPGTISPPPLRRKTSRAHADAPAINTAHFRIFSWNVNGVTPFLQKSIKTFFSAPKDGTSKADPGYSLRSFLRRHQWPQMLCLQEVKISPKDQASKRALERAANTDVVDDDGPSYAASFCLPSDKHNAKGFGGRVYGVATFVRTDLHGHIVHRTREVEWDMEGRVLITELKCKVAIINGYWVNGTTNPYRDATGEVAGVRHDRKRLFHTLMLNEALAYEKAGWRVVLIGDMNVARSPLDGHPEIRYGMDHVVNRADFNRKFFTDKNGLQAIDAFRHLHGDAKKYTYYGRSHAWGESCDRVDLAIVSNSMVETGVLVETDILNTAIERGHSDHVPLYVELDLKRLDSADTETETM